MEQKITALDLLDCPESALYVTFMIATKGFRFINRVTKRQARDKAQVYWGVFGNKNLRQALYVIADGTDDKWEIVSKKVG